PVLTKGYALTLNIEKREKGKVKGRIQLCVPDEKQTYIAGEFTAEILRSRDELPGEDDMPFIHGSLSVAGVGDPNVVVGYLRVDPVEPPISDLLGVNVGPSGGSPTRAEAYRPRYLTLIPASMKDPVKEPARYEMTRLEPGRYWVFARTDRISSWKWVTV